MLGSALFGGLPSFFVPSLLKTSNLLLKILVAKCGVGLGRSMEWRPEMIQPSPVITASHTIVKPKIFTATLLPDFPVGASRSIVALYACVFSIFYGPRSWDRPPQ